jgi:hypothetical protein
LAGRKWRIEETRFYFYAESVLQRSPGLPDEIGLPWDEIALQTEP